LNLQHFLRKNFIYLDLLRSNYAEIFIVVF